MTLILVDLIYTLETLTAKATNSIAFEYLTFSQISLLIPSDLHPRKLLCPWLQLPYPICFCLAPTLTEFSASPKLPSKFYKIELANEVVFTKYTVRMTKGRRRAQHTP